MDRVDFASLRRWLPEMAGNLNAVRAMAACVVLISVFLGLLMGEVVNRDGILYISTAQAYLDGGFKAAMGQYNWPAYSILFALISEWTGLSLEASAHLLNTLLMLLLVDSFLRFSHQLLQENSRPWIAALVILSFPPFDHRLEIYRDWGYLAFTLCALVPLLRFWSAEAGRVRDVIVWQLCMLGALLFRVEAVALIVLAPLALLMQSRPWPMRLRRYLAANALIVLILVVGLLLVVSGTVPLGKLTDLAFYADPALVFSRFQAAAKQIADVVLNKYSDDYATLILGGGIFTLISWMVLDNLGAFLVLVTGVGLFRYRFPAAYGYRLVYWLFCMVVLTLCVFLVVRLITVSRYALLGSLLLLTLTVYAVNHFAEARASGRRTARYGWWFVLAGLVIGNLANLALRPDYKGYLREGGHWLRQNAPASAELISNDFIIDYYAQRPRGEKLDNLEKVAKALKSTSPPFFVALKTNDKDRQEVLALMSREPLVEFHSGSAKEGMLIFRVERSP